MKPDKKIALGLADLFQRDLYLGSILMKLEFRPTSHRQVVHSDVRTMATDSVYLIYNPAFVKGLSAKQLLACLAHEAAHVAFKHPTTRDHRNLKLWNDACDYFVNLILSEAGYELPDGCKFEISYRGFSSEQIYTFLLDSELERIQIDEHLHHEMRRRILSSTVPQPDPDPDPDDPEDLDDYLDFDEIDGFY